MMRELDTNINAPGPTCVTVILSGSRRLDRALCDARHAAGTAPARSRHLLWHNHTAAYGPVRITPLATAQAHAADHAARRRLAGAPWRADHRLHGHRLSVVEGTRAS